VTKDPTQQQLESPDPAARADAIRALAAGGEPAQVGPLIAALLADSDELVRAEATDVLGELGYGPALDAIRALLRADRSALVRAAAAESLGDLGQPSALVELVGALDDDDAAVRAYTANSVGLIAGPESIPSLELRLGVEPEPSVRVELHGARYRLGAPGALAELIALLDGMDLDLGYNVLNVWDDLISRRKPSTLEADALAIVAALTRVGSRISELRGHANSLAVQLATATQ
jgi:HEAT repeat protein